MTSPEDREFECFQWTVEGFRAKILGTHTHTDQRGKVFLIYQASEDILSLAERTEHTLHLVFCPKHRSMQVAVCLFHRSISRESELSPGNKIQLLLTASASEVTQEEVNVNLPVQEKASSPQVMSASSSRLQMSIFFVESQEFADLSKNFLISRIICILSRPNEVRRLRIILEVWCLDQLVAIKVRSGGEI